LFRKADTRKLEASLSECKDHMRSSLATTWLGSAAHYIGHGSLSEVGPLWVICLGDGLDWLQIVLDLNRPRYRVVHGEVVACLDTWPCAIPVRRLAARAAMFSATCNQTISGPRLVPSWCRRWRLNSLFDQTSISECRSSLFDLLGTRPLIHV
jgi:hypothetical protein